MCNPIDLAPIREEDENWITHRSEDWTFVSRQYKHVVSLDRLRNTDWKGFDLTPPYPRKFWFGGE